MLERLLIAALVVAGIAAAIAVTRLALRLRDRRIVERLRETSAGGSPGVPRVVYFTTTSCVVCRLQQEPATWRGSRCVCTIRASGNTFSSASMWNRWDGAFRHQ